MSNNLTSWSKEKLIKHISELTELLEDKFEQNNRQFMVEFPWAGNLGQWQWLYQTNIVTFNDKKAEELGYDPNKIGEVGFEFYTDKLHPDDYESTMDNMRNLLSNKSDVYEVQYRIQHKDGHYLWYYDRGAITKRNDNGDIVLIEGVVFNITESKKIEEKLRFLSETDELTETYNRRVFFEELDNLIEQSKKNIPYSLIMFDIDHFKSINDTYGHVVGDKVLQKLAKKIKDNLRKTDTIYRYGGEEFFISLENTTLDTAVSIAERFRTLIEEMNFDNVGNITVSMGVVEYNKKDTVDEVISRVDGLMYEAKEAGRNQVKY